MTEVKATMGLREKKFRYGVKGAARHRAAPVEVSAQHEQDQKNQSSASVDSCLHSLSSDKRVQDQKLVFLAPESARGTSPLVQKLITRCSNTDDREVRCVEGCCQADPGLKVADRHRAAQAGVPAQHEHDQNQKSSALVGSCPPTLSSDENVQLAAQGPGSGAREHPSRSAEQQGKEKKAEGRKG